MGDGATRAGNGRAVRIALFLSLAVNLIVAGLFLGASFGGHPMRPGMMRPDVGFGPLTGSLTRADRKALRERFEAAAPDFRAERRAADEDFLAFAALLQADSWDPAAAEALLARQGDRMGARLVTGRAIFLDYVADLSPAARQALGERVEQELLGRGE